MNTNDNLHDWDVVTEERKNDDFYEMIKNKNVIMRSNLEGILEYVIIKEKENEFIFYTQCLETNFTNKSIFPSFEKAFAAYAIMLVSDRSGLHIRIEKMKNYIESYINHIKSLHNCEDDEES